MDGKQLQEQYKHHISNYRHWDQQEHAAEWILYPQNIGRHLSIDETSLSNDELYTIVTNKAAKGQKGALVAMIRGTQAENIIEVLKKIPERLRNQVEEVTLDMAPSMNLAVERCFRKAHRVTDRFHVQRLACDAVQELRIQYRWEALDEENEAIKTAKGKGETFVPGILENGDTLKQLLARSRYLLFKHKDRWTSSQKLRASLLFERFPRLREAYYLSLKLGIIYRTCRTKEEAFKKLALWFNEVEASSISSFKTVVRTVETHYLSILNFFNNRSANASAESFNAKLKSFRSSSRGVRDIPFFLFRLANIYA
ncbi:ISAon1 family transposase [Taibaiella koreensis]|uniref:ISAon1 family transposase n=1 Tax=Taibaiella koreensis TaxID=1268548 RepID=UPI000E59E197|nr:transposase [Taibaiella koreensis]